MFAKFDYGKGLQKQLEAHSRLPASQKQKRLEAMVKQYEQYAARLVSQVTQPGASNPGQMKNAAEILVDSAAILQDAGPAYRTFAELVARSRKVPVIPGLAGMVDRLLEQSTDLKRERAVLLSWRVITGTMKPDRYIKYLVERARLTDEVDDWKDLAWGITQLVKKGSIASSDEAVFEALMELHSNRQKLGDQAQTADLALTESLLARRSARQAEEILMLLASENKTPSPQLLERVDVLLDARAEACWELHQLIITTSLERFEAGSLGWTALQEKITRARLHRAAASRWLLDNPLVAREPRLAQLILNNIRASGADDAELLEEKLATLLSRAGAAMPSASEPINESEPEPELELVTAEESGEETEEHVDAAGPEDLRAPGADAEESEAPPNPLEDELELVVAAAPELSLLGEAAEQETRDPEAAVEEMAPIEAEELEAQVVEPDGDASDDADSQDLGQKEPAQTALSVEEHLAEVVADEEAVLAAAVQPEVAEDWLAPVDAAAEADLGQPAAAGLGELPGSADDSLLAAAPIALAEVEPSELQTQTELGPAAAYEADNSVAGLIEIVHEALADNDFATAFELAAESAPGPERQRAFSSLEEWLVVLASPTPQSMVTLAKVNRELSGDPRSGFEAATTADLLAPQDEAITSDYKTWLDVVPEADVRRERARQSAYLAVAKQDADLIGELVKECVWLAEHAAAESADMLAWLEQVRPVLDQASEDVRRLRLYAWTRMYLQLMAQSAQHANLAAELRRASSDLAPQEALTLVSLFGAEIPAEARFEVECKSLLREGRWQDAVELVGAHTLESAAPSLANESLDLLYGLLPEDALAGATSRVLSIAGGADGAGGTLSVIRYLSQRFEGNAPPAMQAVLDQALSALCDAGDDAALRYRLATRQSVEDVAASAADLIQLAEQGDPAAQVRLEELLPALLERRDQPGLAQRSAFAVASSIVSADRQRAVLLISRTGIKTGDPAWARTVIQGLGGPGSTVDAIEAVGKLALAAGDLTAALDHARTLLAAGADAQAYEVIEPVIERDPSNNLGHLAMLEVLLGKDLGDPATALQHAIHLVQQEPAAAHSVEAGLARLAGPAMALAADKPHDASAQLAAFCVLAGGGRMAEATAAAQAAVRFGGQSGAQVLKILDRIALRDADLPSGILLAWGRALIDAGKVEQALDRIAGLRDSVEDYPEYIGLLEEIKSVGAGPGVNMQLGEAYLRVSLWQRAATEYSAALDTDAGLAAPVLTQLRSHGALEPNPNKYPLHLIALRAVGLGERETDWGWALSALAWLMPRWNAEELYAVARDLWKRAESDELEEADKAGLLISLYDLARNAGDPHAALDYIAAAWKRLPEPSVAALDAVQSFDPAQIAGDAARLAQLYRLRLEAAVTRGSSELVAAAAEQLAGSSPEDREFALAVLRSFQQQSDDKIPLLLTRLRLVQADGPQAYQEFIGELAEAARAGLSTSQLRELIHAAQAMAKANPQAPEPQGMLLQLFDQLGDQARLWQLAMWHATIQSALAPEAEKLLSKVAGDEFALRQQLELLSLRLQQGQFAEAAARLGQIDPENFGELAEDAAVLAEAMYGTPADEAGRRWLCARLRQKGELVLAADHLVWAHAAGLQLPSAWLAEEKSPLLLLRAARISEISQDREAALRLYRQAASDHSSGPEVAVSALLRLAEMAAEFGDLHEAVRAGQAACASLPSNEKLTAQVRSWETQMHLAEIESARQRPDNAERTLEIARHLVSCGETAEAINELQAGITRGQEQPEVYNELGLCFLAGRDAKLARRAFTEALASIGANKQAVELKLAALYGLSQAEEMLGSMPEAIHCLEQLLVIRNSYRDSRERLERLNQAQLQRPPSPGADATGQLLDEILSMLGESKDGGKGAQ